MRDSDTLILENLYEILTEGLEEKIPKLLNMVPPKIIDKESYIRWAAATFDPTPQAEYIVWVLKMLKKNVLRGEEDSEKSKKILKTFTDLKKKPQFPSEFKDINKFQDLGSLDDVIEKYLGVKTKGETVKQSEEAGKKLLISDGDYKIFVVTTQEAAAKNFRTTNWCVKDPKYFNQYTPKIYYYITKNDQSYMLVHLESNQCKDVRDSEILSEFIDGKIIEMMNTKIITEFVLNNDDSLDSLFAFIHRFGGGYENGIKKLSEEHLKSTTSRYKISDYTVNYDIKTDNDTQKLGLFGKIIGNFYYDFSDVDPDFIYDNYLENFSRILNEKHRLGRSFHLDTMDTENGYISYDINIEDILFDSDSILDNIDQVYQLAHTLQENYKKDSKEFEEFLTTSLKLGGWIDSNFLDFFESIDENGFENFKVYKNLKDGVIKFTTMVETDIPNTDMPKSVLNPNFIILTPHERDVESNDISKILTFLKPLGKFEYTLTKIPNKEYLGLYMVGKIEYELSDTLEKYKKQLKNILDIDKNFDTLRNRLKDFIKSSILPIIHVHKNIDDWKFLRVEGENSEYFIYINQEGTKSIKVPVGRYVPTKNVENVEEYAEKNKSHILKYFYILSDADVIPIDFKTSSITESFKRFFIDRNPIFKL